MSADDTPARGIERPSITALLEADPLTVACREAVDDIRAMVAASAARLGLRVPR